MTTRIEKKMEKDVVIFNLPNCNKNGLVHEKVYCTSRIIREKYEKAEPNPLDDNWSSPSSISPVLTPIDQGSGLGLHWR
jgi:hypothetical protein